MSQHFIFYHAIGRFLCVFTTRPMLRAVSKDLECPASSVCGVGSYFRRLLHLLTDKMFVGKFSSAECDPKVPYRNAQAEDRSRKFTGTSHKFDERTRKKKSADRPHGTVKLAHRGWTSMLGAHKSSFLLNPNVNVREVLGPFTTSEMAEGVRDLICDLRRTAEMSGELRFLTTLEQRWRAREDARAASAPLSNWSAVVSAGKDKPVVDAPGASAADRRRAANAVASAQYFRNMHKAQWAVCEIMQDVVRAMEKWFDHELYSLFGFLACMIQTRWVDVLKVQTGEKMKILIAHEEAIPNGHIGSRILDELGERFRGQGEQQFLDFYPPQLADMLKDEAAMRQFPEFLRGDAMVGFHLLDAQGNVLYEDIKPLTTDANGNIIKRPIVAGPASLWRFPELARRVLKLYFRQMSSNDVERVLSLVAGGYRGGGKNVGFRCISSWIRRRDWVSARFFRMEADPAFLDVYREARRLIRVNHKGFQQVFTQDVNTSELRNRWRQQKKVPDYIKNGVKLFDKTNIVPGMQELFAVRKSEDNEQLAARVVNSKRKRQQVVERLKAIKVSSKPRVKAAVVRTGKRKRLEALNQKGFPNHETDCGDAHDVPATNEEPQIHGQKEDVRLKQGTIQCSNSDAKQQVGNNGACTKKPKISDDASVPGTGTLSGDPAAGGAAAAHSGAGCCSSHRRVQAVQNEMNGLNEMNPWAPSVRVQVGGAAGAEQSFVLGMKRPNGQVNVVRANSCCTLNYVYDESDGAVKIIQITSTKLPKERRSRRPDRGQQQQGPFDGLYMEYYFVYPNARAQCEAEYQDDTTIILGDDGAQKTFKQIGANTLVETAKSFKGVALHHAGDILHKSSERGSMNLGNIVGTIAWVTAQTLIDNGSFSTKLSIEGAKELSKNLQALGCPKLLANELASDPIFLSCIFGERRPATTADDDEDGSQAEEEEGGTCSTGPGSDLIAPHPGLEQARAYSRTLRMKAQLADTATCSNEGVGGGGGYGLP